ncbi:MAG: hypothetical protein PF448_08965 [Bacteroidales bacterium]|jgi:hypothetical protein|nr:hypothetical protein [Bacteroidales bacterium]
MINNYDELILVKNELKNRVHQTEQDFINQYELISTFIKVSEIHKDTKHEEKRRNIHALIIQSITEYLKEQKVLKKYKAEYTTIGIPIILTLISSLIMKNRN